MIVVADLQLAVEVLLWASAGSAAALLVSVVVWIAALRGDLRWVPLAFKIIVHAGRVRQSELYRLAREEDLPLYRARSMKMGPKRAPELPTRPSINIASPMWAVSVEEWHALAARLGEVADSATGSYRARFDTALDFRWLSDDIVSMARVEAVETLLSHVAEGFRSLSEDEQASIAYYLLLAADSNPGVPTSEATERDTDPGSN